MARRRGRLRKPAHERRVVVIAIKATPAERELYRRAAEACGYANLATWFRYCANERIALLRKEGRLD